MNNVLKKIISLLLILTIIGCGYIIWDEYSQINKQTEDVKAVKDIIKKNVNLNVKEDFNEKAFAELKELNSDFIAYVKIDNIVEQPVVKTTDNDYYLHRTFSKEWATNNGNPFMDYRANLSDNNFTIYGHNNSYKHDIIFSRLNDMAKSQEYYEEHSKITLYTENDIREYEICYVYYIDNEQYQNYDFQQTTFFDAEDFNEFIKFPKQHSLIKSMYGDIKYGDNLITLQTCKRLNQDVKVVVVAKEIVRKGY